MTSSIRRSWSILLQTVPGASRSLFLYILLSDPAQAIIDTNSNGVSDLWEKTYNSGTLFTNFAPLADPDGDDWTNATEAISGTDPFNANTPTGILRPQIIQSLAVYITGTNGEPELFTPAAVSITWPTLAGKQYTLFASVDLSQGSWLAIDNDTPRIGTTDAMGNAFPIAQPDGSSPPTMFYRVAINDADSDGDTLTNSEENTLGTDPEKSDSDGDELPDGWEVTNDLDPNDNGTIDPDNGTQGDPDNDGIPNGTDSTPQSADELTFTIETTSIHFEMDQDSPYRTETTSTEYVSMDRILMRYPNPGLLIPVGWVNYDEAARYGDLVKSKITLKAKTPSDSIRKFRLMNVLDYDDISAPAEFRDPIELTIPAQSLTSETFDYTPGLTDLGTTTPTTKRIGYAIDVSIKPDKDMAGVIGDVVKPISSIGYVRHFVTPKETTELSQDYVDLKADGIAVEHITEGHINQLFVWEGGEEVPGNPLKRKVKRDVAKREIVRVKAKNGGMVAAEMHVWVVWCDITATPGTSSYSQYSNGAGAKYEISVEPNQSWKFVFKISPYSIIDPLALNRPDLTGNRFHPPPGASKPYGFLPSVVADDANKKWDVSRQYQVRIRNPDNINIQGQNPSAWYAPQIPITDVPVRYPDLDYEGNDDPAKLDEQVNPYQEFSGYDLNHQIGELSSTDSPTLSMDRNLGIEDANFAKELNFKEFARVELWDDSRVLGRFWFRVSDHYLWHHYLDTTFSGDMMQWMNTGSSSGVGHSKP